MVQFFDPTQEQEIKRRRRMAEALQKESGPKKTEMVGGYAVQQSGLEQLARGLSGGLGAYQGAQADNAEKELATQKQQLLGQALSSPDAKTAAGLLAQNPEFGTAALKLFGDDLENKQKLEVAKIRAGGTEPYFDETTGEMVTPLPKLSATEQKAFDTQQNKVDSIESAQDAFGQIKEYQAKPMFSGFAAETRAAANRIPGIGLLIDDEKAANTTAYQNLIKTGQYKQLASTFPGAISNSERESLEKLGALASYTPQEQSKIIADAEGGLSKLLAKSKQRAADIASGKQYRKAVTGLSTGDTAPPAVPTPGADADPRIAKAKAAGYSDAEIQQYLSGR